MFDEEEYSRMDVNWLESGLEYLLKEHKELESVKIGSVNIGKSKCTDRSLQAIFSFPNMKSIHLEKCDIRGEIDATTPKLALKVLKLVYCCELTRVGLLNLLNLIDGKSLTELDVHLSTSCNNHNVFSKISSCATTFPNLEVLNIIFYKMTEENLYAFLERSGDKLKNLNLRHSEISLDSICYLPITFPWLEILDLGFCRNLTDAGFLSLLNRVGVQLTRLDINRNSLSLSQADSLNVTFPKLKELYMEGCCNITDSGFISLLNRVGAQLTSLNIKRNSLSLSQVDSLTATFPKLVELDMEDCRNITDFGFLSLLNRAGRLSSFRIINIDKTNVSAACVADLRTKCPRIQLVSTSIDLRYW